MIDAIENVDLPILDWNLFKDDGDTIISVLKYLMEVRGYPEGRVSLILIYTREPVLGAMGRLQDEFDRLIPDQGRDNVLAMKGLRIVFVNRLSIDEKKLPDLIIDEFSEAHRGILENGVMQAISEIREKTYHLLSRFPAKLDAPFLAHQAALPHPDDSGVHAVELITSEIVSLLMQAGLPGEIVSEEAIEAILVNADNGILGKTRNRQERAGTRDEIRKIITSGAYEKSVQLVLGEKETLAFKSNKSNAITMLTNILSGIKDVNDPKGIVYNAKLAQLFSLQGHYSEHAPVLSLGTIVQAANDYLVCILPYCDSERIEDERDFPFLKLECRDPSKGGGEICFVVGDDVKLFRTILSPYEMEIHPFPVNPPKKRVLAIQEGNEWNFRNTDGNIFRWAGTLKRECAQRIANDFGAKISRVGLNESEWQRR